MDLEELRLDIFRLFDLRIDRDDPIWAFLYANKEIIKRIESLLKQTEEIKKESETEFKTDLKKEFRSIFIEINETLEEFKKVLHINTTNISESYKQHNSLSGEEIEKIVVKLNENITKAQKNIEVEILNAVRNLDISSISYEVSRKINLDIKKSVLGFFKELDSKNQVIQRNIDNLSELKRELAFATEKVNKKLTYVNIIAFFQTFVFGITLSMVMFIYFDSRDKQIVTSTTQKAVVQVDKIENYHDGNSTEK